jgi:hypothetical protein
VAANSSKLLDTNDEMDILDSIAAFNFSNTSGLFRKSFAPASTHWSSVKGYF